MHLASPYMLLCLGFLPCFIATFAWGDRKRRLAQMRFQSSAPTQVDVSRRWWKRNCVLAAAASLILALSRPVSRGPDPAVENTGDIVFLLDVSRSMLSVDAQPTRLARAKSIIASLVEQVRGERTALVAFAGVSSVQCPLTIDQAFFRAMLERASPESVTRGGTRIGDAIQFSVDSVFDDVVRARKQLVIVTDGGDLDSNPTIAARAVLRQGIRLLVIGVGDKDNGALVPTSASDPTPILYGGEQVRTKLEQGLLQTIAEAGAGAYFNAGALESDAADIYRRFLNPVTPPRSREAETSASSWFVLFAIVLLITETLLSDRKVRSAALAVIVIADLSAQTPAESVAEGNAAYRESHWSQAVDSYEMAARSKPMLPQAHFDMGLALYRMQQYSSASDAFGRAAAASRGTPLEATSKLGQANCAYRVAIDAPQVQAQQLLRRVLSRYEELSAIPDARFNADVVRQRLADLLKRQSMDAPGTPSARKKASGPHDIVEQGGVPGKTRAQNVDRDW
jgi:hypothetical protein